MCHLLYQVLVSITFLLFEKWSEGSRI